MFNKRLLWVLGVLLILSFVVGAHMITQNKIKKVEAGAVVLEKETKPLKKEGKGLSDKAKRLEDLDKRLAELNKRFAEVNKHLEDMVKKSKSVK